MIFVSRRWRPLEAVVALAISVSALFAQTPTPELTPSEIPFDFHAGQSYRGKLPPPEAILGYQPGDSYADYGEFLRVLDAYRSSDRLRIFPTGMTNERRPMHVLAISSPANLKRLAEIKSANQKLADGRSELSARDLDKLLADQPIIVWLGYNIHGDEAAGTEAAMQVLYTLLDGDSPALKAWLNDVVVIMNPCQNPDGRERFVTWARAHGIGRPETFAYEKENPWNVQGRFNHYYFDLNRDMIAQSQVESRNSGAAFLDWSPQVSVDHHGETKEFFFPPAALPINPNLPRESLVNWLDTFGRGNAEAFDRQGWMYYVRDLFDIFYAGYWDSWPALQGATGMTYETSGGGKDGRNLRRDDGTITTLRAAMGKHFTASLATIATAAANRVPRLRDFRAHFVSAVATGHDGGMAQVFFPAVGDVGGRETLVTELLRSGVEVQRLTQPVTLPAAWSYFGGEATEQLVPAGSYVVDLAQPRGRVARALLERQTPMDEEFAERQQAKAVKNRQRGENVPADDYEFYDITAWSLPLMNNVPAFGTDAPVAVAATTVTLSQVGIPPPGDDADRARLRATRPRSAWIVPAGSIAAQRAVVRLLSEGYRVATAVRPFAVGSQTFPRGSFILRVERNPVDLGEKVVDYTWSTAVRPVPVDTAFADTGITGIGSESVFSLRAPKVLVAAGAGVNPSSYGALWYLFSQELGVEFVPVAVGQLGGIDLRGFNVIVLPSGRSATYAGELREAGKAKLKAWAEAGGTLICLGGATELAVDADTGWTSVKRVGADKADRSKTPPAEADEPAPPDAEPLPVPGAVLRTRVDHEHFLTFGYDQDELPLLVNTDTFFTASETGTNVLTFAKENVVVAGYVWPDNTERLIGGTAAVVDEPVGQGHIVLFSDEPGYRALWRATTPMLMNAILYGPGLRNETGSYER